MNGVRGVRRGELQKGRRENLPPTGSGGAELSHLWPPGKLGSKSDKSHCQGCSRQEGCSSLVDATCATPPQEWAWDAIRELVRSFCKFRREMKDPKRRAEFEEFLHQERRNERESMSSVLPPLLLPPQDTPGFR